MNINSNEIVTQQSPRGPAWTAAPPAWGRADLWALAFWTLVVVVVFRDALLFGKALFYLDITEINYPYRDFLAQEIRAGRFSRWHPGLYCGLPLFSESQAGYLHPLKYLFLLWMTTWRAFNFDTVGSVWLTGLGTYLWLRRRVGAIAALSGAAVFATSGYVWGHLIHTSMVNALISVPFLFWAIEDVWETGRRRGLAIGAAAFAIQVFAGHLQDALLTALAVAFYTIDRALIETNRRDRLRALGTTGFMLTAGVLLAGVQWLPSKELLDRSPRAGGLTWAAQVFGSWSPELAPTLLLKEAFGSRARDTDWMDGFYPYHEMNCYMGLVGLGLAILGAAAYRDRWAGFWLLFSIVGFALMLGRFTILFDYVRDLPIIGSMRIPVRFHLWVSLGVAALAAVGVDRLARPGFVSLRAVAWGIGGLTAFSLCILAYIYLPFWTQAYRWPHPDQLRRSHWLSRELAIGATRMVVLGVCAWLVARRASRTIDAKARARIAALLPVLVLIDLVAAHKDDAPTIDSTYWTVAPESVKRIKKDRHIGRVYGWSILSSGEPGYASRHADFFGARDSLAWSLPPVWGLSSATGITPMISTRCKLYTDSAKVGRGRYDVEGVTHVLWPNPHLPRTIAGFEIPAEKVGNLYIHRDSATLPRARLMGSPIYARDEKDAAAHVYRVGRAIRHRLIVEDPDHPLATTQRGGGKAEIVVDLTERVEVETESTAPSYLVLADTFDPGWSATVDGLVSPIRPAYVAFRAVFLNPGKHRVIFTYSPKYFQEGLWMTASGCVMILLMLVWPGRRARSAVILVGRERRRFWPLFAIGALLVVVIASIFISPPARSPADLHRWRTGLHRFTWGARLESMKQPR